jgi:hypothetical protein
MKDVYVVSWIAIVYGIILNLVIWMLYSEFLMWSLLGVLTALFNHSQMIQMTKHKVDAMRITMSLVTRFVMYLIMMAIVFIQLRNNQSDLITAYIILLLGFSSIKISTVILTLPIFKKYRKDSTHE